MWWHRVALGLKQTVAWCKRNIDSYELESWKAFYQREPWGLESVLLAQLISMQHKVNFRPPHPTVVQILGVRAAQPQRKTPAQNWATLVAFAATHNAMIKAQQKNGC